jgi:hypothetical protein
VLISGRFLNKNLRTSWRRGGQSRIKINAKNMVIFFQGENLRIWRPIAALFIIPEKNSRSCF